MSQYINLNSSNPAAMSGWDSKEIYMQRRETVHFPVFWQANVAMMTPLMCFSPQTVLRSDIYSQTEEQTHFWITIYKSLLIFSNVRAITASGWRRLQPYRVELLMDATVLPIR